MSSEAVRALRFLLPCDKEYKITRLAVTDTPALFSTQLGVTRKRLLAFNKSDSGSGEVYYGPANTVSATTGFPVPKAEPNVEIPLQSGEVTSIYFVAESGEKGDLRILECG